MQLSLNLPDEMFAAARAIAATCCTWLVLSTVDGNCTLLSLGWKTLPYVVVVLI